MTILQSPRRIQLFNAPDSFSGFARRLEPVCWLPLMENSGAIAKNAVYTQVTDLLSGEGAFDSAVNWTVATPPWSIGSGVATYDDTATNAIQHALSAAAAKGDTLDLRFGVTAAGSMLLQPRSTPGDPGWGNLSVETGTYRYPLVLAADFAGDFRLFAATSGVAGSVDNVILNKTGEVDGVIAGTTTLAQAGLRGPNHAYLLDGATSLITVYNRTSLQGLTEFSLWALFKPSSTGENDSGTLFSKDDEFEVRFNSSSRDLIATVNYDTTNAQVVTSTTLSADQWHSIGLRIDDSGKAIDLFVDGVEANYASEQTGVGSRVSNTNDLIVGNNAAINQTLAALLDEVLVVDRALTNNEFALLHQLTI